MDVNTKRQLLRELAQKMRGDKSLPLREGATNLVFGEGDANACLMFIGEGPGFWEDKKAKPFVGNAGALLNQLLSLIKLPREDVFITNVIHYRPPANRDPSPDEIAAFEKYLDKIIEIVSPKIIVTLGRFSMGKFIPNARISSVHGRAHKLNWKGKEIVIFPMYHPAAGLRSPEIKDGLFEDFRRLADVIKNLEEKNDKKAEQMSLV